MGTNTYTVSFTPDADYIPGNNQILDSYDTVNMTHQVNYRTFSGNNIYVSPTGTQGGAGTVGSPIDIYTAINYVKAGQTIQLAGGTYDMVAGLNIQRGIDGSSDKVIVMKAEDSARAILNFDNASTGMSVWGDYWFIENIDITKTPGNTKGLQIAGSNNVISQVNAYKNGDTGIQISGTGSETIEKWPTDNRVINCTSYDNMDPGMNNADGFAAKITVAGGNIFTGCIAYNNLDDGWDLFAKIESGPIGVVTIDNCVAFNNGTLTTGVGNGDGNGFKLGGDGIAVAHVLMNSIAYNNNTNGVTSNSNPAVIVRNVTSYGNKGKNIYLYGKGDGERDFVMNGVISMACLGNDDISEMPSLAGELNYLSISGVATNGLGATLGSSVFISTDISILPGRSEDGSIDMKGLLELNDLAPVKVGATLRKTPIEAPVSTGNNDANNNNSNNGNSNNENANTTPEEVIDEEDVPENSPMAVSVQGHWVEQYVLAMLGKGIIHSDEEMDVDESVSRNVFVTYLMRALMPEIKDEASMLARAVEKGWIQGYGDGTYGMDQTLTREMAMVIMARVLRQQDGIVLKDIDFSQYKDLEKISSWAIEDIYYVVRAGLFRGRSDATLNPKDEMTFAEVLKVISSFID